MATWPGFCTGLRSEAWRGQFVAGGRERVEGSAGDVVHESIVLTADTYTLPGSRKSVAFVTYDDRGAHREA